jgi:hypothetical protein
MRSIHLVIPDLFLPQQAAAEACTGLALPALQTLLARARSSHLPFESLESWLCNIFGVENHAIAPVTLRADGLEPGSSYWLRADPVHLRLQRDQLILQSEVRLTSGDAEQLCISLNTHFISDGLRFFAPHPQRWYLQLEASPNISTHDLAQVEGTDVHLYLPRGLDALRWHGLFNEIQMLLFEHAVNQAREARGELPINSLWLWGGGHDASALARPCAKMVSDSVLANAFARAADIPFDILTDDALSCITDNTAGKVLMIWEELRRALQQGDMHAWRESTIRFERCCAKPLLNALRAGHIDELTLDVPQAKGTFRFVITRGLAWKLWRRPKPLADYAI